MHIRTIEVRKLSSHNYDNITVGITVERRDDEDPEAVFSAAEAWVDEHLNRQQEREDLSQQLWDVQSDLGRKRFELQELTERAKLVRDVLAAHGVPTDDIESRIIPF